MRQAEADAGKRPQQLTSDERTRLTELEGGVREVRKANEILKAASLFATPLLRPAAIRYR